jgi:hypothetical protein
MRCFLLAFQPKHCIRSCFQTSLCMCRSAVRPSVLSVFAELVSCKQSLMCVINTGNPTLGLSIREPTCIVSVGADKLAVCLSCVLRVGDGLQVRKSVIYRSNLHNHPPRKGNARNGPFESRHIRSHDMYLSIGTEVLRAVTQ